MNTITRLENISIEIIREAYACFEKLSVLWSIGKDSTVLLWLIRKAFFGHVPFTLIHVDTSYKIPEMIAYRDRLVQELSLQIIVVQNKTALETNQTFPDGTKDRLSCCKLLKTQPLNEVLAGKGHRVSFDHENKCFEPYTDPRPFNGAIIGLRADEEGSRSKERYFSPRNTNSNWDMTDQPPELWNQYNTEFAPGTHVRVHPLLDWTELNIWEYIHRESIPTVSLYYDQGEGKRYRSIGCYPCTLPVNSKAKSPLDIIMELDSGQFSRVPERAGRAQDKEGDGGLESLRKKGYM